MSTGVDAYRLISCSETGDKLGSQTYAAGEEGSECTKQTWTNGWTGCYVPENSFHLEYRHKKE